MARPKNLIELMGQEDRLVDRLLRLSRRLTAVRDRRRRLERRLQRDSRRARYEETCALTVPCTWCNVDVGAECQLPGGEAVSPHLERVRAAEGSRLDAKIEALAPAPRVSDEQADEAFDAQRERARGPR